MIVPRGGEHADAPAARFTVERSGDQVRVQSDGAPGTWAVEVLGFGSPVTVEPGEQVVVVTLG